MGAQTGSARAGKGVRERFLAGQLRPQDNVPQLEISHPDPELGEASKLPVCQVGSWFS